MSIDTLLATIQRTNKDMTKEKLLKELKQSPYSTVAILMTMENVKRVAD